MSNGLTFVGKEFFVGLSEWTNEAGAKAVAGMFVFLKKGYKNSKCQLFQLAAFPEYPCVPIKVRRFSNIFLMTHTYPTLYIIFMIFLLISHYH